MRKSLLLATGLAGILIAPAAWADGNPSTPASGGGATAAFAVLAAPLLPPIEHIDLAAQQAFVDDPFNRLKGAIRHRFASAMIDLYPAAASGFHLSFGTRFFKKQNFLHDQQEATHNLLYGPRLPRGGYGQRGFRRATPAATIGYTAIVQSNLAIGVEAGTLLGRVVDFLPDAQRLAADGLRADHDHSTQMNPVVNLTVGYAF